jgi:hypothetical protein
MVKLTTLILGFAVTLCSAPSLCNAQSLQAQWGSIAFEVQRVAGNSAGEDSFNIYVQGETQPGVTLPCSYYSAPQSYSLCVPADLSNNETVDPIDPGYLYNLVFWLSGVEFGCKVSSEMEALFCQTRTNANENWSAPEIVSQ